MKPAFHWQWKGNGPESAAISSMPEFSVKIY